VSRDLGNRKWEGNALCNLGLLHQLQGNLGEARSTLQRALLVAREMGHARLEAIVLCNLGIVDDATGSPDDALGHFEAALVVARELGDRRSEGQFLGYIGSLHARQGRFNDAHAALEAGAALLRQASRSVQPRRAAVRPGRTRVALRAASKRVRDSVRSRRPGGCRRCRGWIRAVECAQPGSCGVRGPCRPTRTTPH
jgi:tetratricopeptide (TPR) repeat protein